MLKSWYDAYTAGHKQDSTGLSAMAKVLDRTVEEIQADWLKWLAANR